MGDGPGVLVSLGQPHLLAPPQQRGIGGSPARVVRQDADKCEGPTLSEGPDRREGLSSHLLQDLIAPPPKMSAP
eukprot:7178078-Pyramimonas_sp.AAC.1